VLQTLLLVLVVAPIAGVPAYAGGGHTTDATYACVTQQLGGEYQVTASVSAGPRTSSIFVYAGGGTNLLTTGSIGPKPNRTQVDGTDCKKTTQLVPLAAAGLPVGHVYTTVCTAAQCGRNAGRYRQSGYRCVVGSEILVRTRVTFDASGFATRSQLALRGAATGKPIAFFRMTPPLGLKVFVSKACEPH